MSQGEFQPAQVLVCARVVKATSSARNLVGDASQSDLVTDLVAARILPRLARHEEKQQAETARTSRSLTLRQMHMYL